MADAGGWKTQTESRAAPQFTVDQQLAAMALDGMLDDGQTQAGTPSLA
jgi:hypothetical protein